MDTFSSTFTYRTMWTTQLVQDDKKIIQIVHVVIYFTQIWSGELYFPQKIVLSS